MAAALEPLLLPFYRLSHSPNPPLTIPARTNLSIPISTTKFPNKSYPRQFSISKKRQVPSCSSSSLSATAAIEDEVSVAQTEKPEKGIGHNRVFVLNLPWSFSVDVLKNLFGECGTVQDAQAFSESERKTGGAMTYTLVVGENVVYSNADMDVVREDWSRFVANFIYN